MYEHDTLMSCIFFDSKDHRFNACFWETAFLPLPKPNIMPKARSKCHIRFGEVNLSHFLARVPCHLNKGLNQHSSITGVLNLVPKGTKLLGVALLRKARCCHCCCSCISELQTETI